MSRLSSLREQALKFFLHQHRVVMAVVSVLILILGYVFLLNAKFTEVRTAGLAGLKSKQTELEDRTLYRDRLQAMIEKFNREVSAEQIDFLDQAIPGGQQIPELLSLLNDLADQSGFKLDNVDINDNDASAAAPVAGKQPAISGVLQAARGETTSPVKPTKASTGTLTVRLTFAGPGGYESLRKLLEAVESSQRLLDVRSLRFTLGSASAGPEGQSTRAEYEMSLTTPYVVVGAPKGVK